VLVSAEEWQRLEELESAEATAWWRRDAAERAHSGEELGEGEEGPGLDEAEFPTGPLLENPHRVGHPLQDEYAGQYSAPPRTDWRVRYRIDEDTRTVIVLDISHRSDTYGA
jgi:mRNA interferase RelE/StbE